MNKEQTVQKLRMMVLITGPKNAIKAVDVLNQKNIPVQYLSRGEGTASNEILDLLGIGSSEKAVLFSVVPKAYVRKLFVKLEERLGLSRLGKGIAFSIPVSNASLCMMKMLCDDQISSIVQKLERSGSQMTNPITHSLLMVTINQGYSEDVMAVAKEAGATGGTVLHARRVGSDEPMKRWGISIQEEKEIVFILTPQEGKMAIMKAVGEFCGIQSKAQGLIVAIPVDAVAGLRDLYEVVDED